MGFTGLVKSIGGMAKTALDTDGSSSGSQGQTVAGAIKSAMMKRQTGDKGAGDLGQMSSGEAQAKTGGTVKKTGYIKLHKGEKVVPKKTASKKTAGKKTARKRV
jgi:hypothetical protein